MRIRSRLAAAALAALASLVLAAGPLPARAQNPDEMLPAQSAARARAILEQAISALGGPAFLDARNFDCTGRFAEFQHSGDIGDFTQFHEYWAAPDKDRIEYGKKGNIANVYSGTKGWTLDRGGVSDIPQDQIADHRRQVQTGVNTILRFRLHEPGLILRYAGSDVVELQEVDWVELTDRQDRLVRIAISKATHLPVRSVLITRNYRTGDRDQSSTDYSSYQLIDGIETPFQISRFINGWHVSQVFLQSCRYNADLPPDLFNRTSLDAYFAKHHKH
jgi:hypothetical protein